MKNLFLCTLVLCVAVNLAFAADNAKPITKAGNAALLFDLGGLANLAAGDYQGGVGFKYYFAKDIALRLGLGFGSRSTTDKNPTPTPPALPANVLSESKLTELSFTVAPGIQYNVATVNAVVGYVGAQVGYTMSSQNRDGNSSSLNAGYQNGASYKVTSSSFGVAAFVGAEWFPWDNISFAAEYRLGFQTSSGKTEIGVPAPGTGSSYDSPSTTSIGLGSGNSAALTLAIYI